MAHKAEAMQAAQRALTQAGNLQHQGIVLQRLAFPRALSTGRDFIGDLEAQDSATEQLQVLEALRPYVGDGPLRPALREHERSEVERLYDLALTGLRKADPDAAAVFRATCDLYAAVRHSTTGDGHEGRVARAAAPALGARLPQPAIGVYRVQGADNHGSEQRTSRTASAPSSPSGR